MSLKRKNTKVGSVRGRGGALTFLRNSSASGLGTFSFLKTEDFVDDCRIFLVASEPVYIAISPLVCNSDGHGSWAIPILNSPLLLTELSSKRDPRKMYLLLFLTVLIVATASFIANGREHSFLIRILELFIISPLFVYQ